MVDGVACGVGGIGLDADWHWLEFDEVGGLGGVGVSNLEDLTELWMLVKC